MKKFLLPLLCIALFSCGENDIMNSTATVTATSITGLPVLGTNYKYEAWLLTAGTYVSIGTFNMGTDGKPTVSSFTNINNNDLENATGMVVTVEYTGSNAKATPSDVRVLVGEFSGNTVTLSPTYSNTPKTIFAEADLKAQYSLFLLTATATEALNRKAGIWFTPDNTQSSAGLTLASSTKLRYQGWMNDGTNDYSMGSFTSATGADDANKYKGTTITSPTIKYPGEDFISIEGGTPIDLVGKTVFITVKPNEETASDTTPVSIPLFSGTITATGTQQLSVVTPSYAATFTR